MRTVDHVVEQCVGSQNPVYPHLGITTDPLLVVLHLIPQSIVAGLFLVMGTQTLIANGITQS